jgi:putative hemolysin
MEASEPEIFLFTLLSFSNFFQPFAWESLLSIALLGILLLCSALISGSETALFSLSPTQRKNLEENGHGRDQQILTLLQKPRKLLATILIANNFVNVAIVLLSASTLHSVVNMAVSPLLAYLIELVLITSLILLVGEIMPKIYASRNAVRFARLVAGPIITLRYILSPFSMILVKSTHIIERRINKKSYNISKDDLSDAIELTSRDDEQARGEKELLRGIVKFGDIDVKEIMTARIDITAAEQSLSFNALLKLILDSGFSRLPVYDESLDRIKGILVIKDLLQHLDKKELEWNSLLRPAYFVPENKKLDDLLREFQEKKLHMAIVVDEYGGTSGIITLEDVLEEIVGDISDEFDIDGQDFQFTRVDDLNYIFEGKTTLNDVCKILDLDDEYFEKERGESDTLAGLLLEITGQIPARNQVISHKGFDFTVTSVDNRRIKRIKVSIRS